ncbi:LysR family transcriptional regulator [Burkholderia sp. Ac-20365]|uniref:LysR family transcriptional regulator n=1 Tax=Burkholderia sp. Ac-20365 TaxID=2703897 RepID=UPI00197BC86A|nr:LysR family transcriptional regulator [Burkholderia sp. Ac-20365]MBN3761424.1 LysR family transcriptional regulator [Burkholderia sp. Ac-20365]
MDQLASMRAFVTVARTQSYTKAADILNVSRAALSRAISDLETHTSSRLLNRTTRRVALAETARDYFDSCSRIIDELEQAERRLIDDKTSECGYVRVVAHPLAVAAGISTLLDAFGATAPCIKIHLTVQDSPLNLIESGYDLSIYPPDRIANATVVNRPLFRSGFVFVASPQYLDKSASLNSICDLPQHRIIDGREEAARKGLEISSDTSTCPPLSLQSVDMNVPSAIARELAMAGAGIALLPEVIVRRDLARGELRKVSFDGEMSLGGIDLGVQYQQASSTPRRTRTFIDACLGYFRSLDTDQEMTAHSTSV